MIEIDLHKQLQAASGELNAHFEGTIQAGQCIALYGVSGAGKTSLLRMLAGLLAPEKGSLKVANEIWYNFKKKIHLTPQQRSVGLVFQDYALFPHLTVEQNLRFALAKKQSSTIIEELLTLTELQQLRHRRPTQLSGGQQQRVALARALVQQPTLLLLDEPLAALDEKMRQQLRDLLQQLRQRYHTTMILVSHDQKDILQLADEVWVVEGGQVQVRVAPSKLFASNMSLLKGTVVQMEQIADEKVLFTLALNDDQHVQLIVHQTMAASIRLGDVLRVDGED